MIEMKYIIFSNYSICEQLEVVDVVFLLEILVSTYIVHLYEYTNDNLHNN